MRRSIRLTGRKQLPQAAFSVQLSDNMGKSVATLALRGASDLDGYPPNAEIRVKLVENKLVEVLKFGTVANPSTSADLAESSFRAPSCQVRIVSRDRAGDGKLLGSTSTWTLKAGGEPDGILLFQPSNIQPLLWKLDIRDSGDEYPILYVDERIPDAGLWAKSDPLFSAAVLPSVIREVMRYVLQDAVPEDGWELDWLKWTGSLMPGSFPPFGKPPSDQEEWITQLVQTFSLRHELSGKVLAAILKQGEHS
jgi:hypothetical protein